MNRNQLWATVLRLVKLAVGAGEAWFDNLDRQRLELSDAQHLACLSIAEGKGIGKRPRTGLPTSPAMAAVHALRERLHDSQVKAQTLEALLKNAELELAKFKNPEASA